MSSVSQTVQAPRLAVEGLEKAFSGVPVLRGISFEAWTGEVLGIVGENGSGKSTLMNIIAGVLPRDGGTMTLDGDPFSPVNRRHAEKEGIAFIQQELNIFPNLSVEENLMLGRAPRIFPSLPVVSRQKRRTLAAKHLLAVGLQVNPGAPASRLSTGERQLLEIARGLSTDSRVMIFDEPTTSLTRQEKERLFDLIGKIKAGGVAVLFISHFLEDVLRLADRVLVLQDGRVMLREKREGLTPDRLIVAMVGRSIDALFPQKTAPAIASETLPLLRVDRVSEPGIVEDISLQVRAGEIVGISGLMGSGRSELARIIFGLDPHSRGEISLNGILLRSEDLEARLSAGMAFLTEDRRTEGLMMEATVADNVALAALPHFARRFDGTLRSRSLLASIKELVKQLQLRCQDISTTPARLLSGGNQQKVVLGRWLLCRPKLFIVDEPTRGVDVGAREEIYRLLAELTAQGMGVLAISSDIEELTGLCDRILVMHRGCLVKQIERQQFDREDILAASFGR